jgi:16S rRNA (cytidine1402-2'-O)-methyltransferase
MHPILYIVATPIGNLGDITLRALEVLKSVDTILCEDTRVTKKLLAKYEIKTPTLSYHEHSTLTKIEKIIELLKEGKSLALVSDAGSPSISDPGSYLVAKVREALPELSMVAVPGPSALTASLSLSGLPASDFLFLGFLPHKKGRETLFSELADSKRTVVFYESPHRIQKSLTRLVECLGEDRQVVVAREITKLHEEAVSGSPQKVLSYFEDHPDKVRGEFVVLVSGVK